MISCRKDIHFNETLSLDIKKPQPPKNHGLSLYIANPTVLFKVEFQFHLAFVIVSAYISADFFRPVSIIGVRMPMVKILNH